MSPSSLYSQQVLCSSVPLSKNVHGVFGVFCTGENIEQSISYLDQVVCSYKKQEHAMLCTTKCRGHMKSIYQACVARDLDMQSHRASELGCRG
jgi:hypothetical protein